MPRSFFALVVVLFFGLMLAGATDASAPSLPLASMAAASGPDYPSRLTIPSIKLDAPVIDVGLNKKGEMDVPDGRTKNVGWYKDGTVPGEVGSAVMDAHVYAAFSKLRYLKVGEDIYVATASGETLHFKVVDSRVYTLDEVPLDVLFNQNDTKRLNLITCAGKFSRSLNTYERRLVVYAVLVD